MTKVDIFSGFLGAGKTTLIKKLIAEAFKGQKLVLIENEFGEIGIDGGFLKDSGIQITEMNSGCICCTLVGDFGDALKDVMKQFNPDRIIIEPSGVGKLSDVIKAIQDVADEAGIVVNNFVAVVDAGKCKMYMKNFGEFFNNQIAYASCVVLSRSQDVNEETVQQCLDIIHELNDHATVVTTPWDEISGDMILKATESAENLEKALVDAEKAHHHDQEHGHHHHHHHDHDHDHDHEHHHHHHEEHDHDEHEHHHHHHHHHHDHDHDHGAAVDEGDTKLYYDEEDLHDADEIFNSIGIETAHKFTKEEIEDKLKTLATDESLGNILRSKGIVAGKEGAWYEFDYVSGDYEIRECTPDVGGRLCVIGEDLDVHKLYALMKG